MNKKDYIIKKIKTNNLLFNKFIKNVQLMKIKKKIMTI